MTLTQLLMPMRRHPFQADRMRYLAQSHLLEETSVPRILHVSVLALAATFSLFIAWASVTKVNEIAKAEGEVMPGGYVQIVQHLEGGIVSEIAVQEGEIVKKGQLLVKLQGSGFEEDLAEMKVRQLSLTMQAKRLRAYIEGKNFDLSAYEKYYANQVKEQERIFADMREARQHEREIAQTQLTQKQESLAMLVAKQNALAKNRNISADRLNTIQTLYNKGLTSRLRLLDTQEELNRINGEISTTAADITRGQEAVKEAKKRLDSLAATTRDNANQQLEQVENQIAQNNEEMLKLQKRVDRLLVRAPVAGIVKGMDVTTIGGVIPAGKKMMEIVPLDEQLRVEAKISTTDVGHTVLGSLVQIKVHSYDFARYGFVEGTLESISATTFIDEHNSNKTYYKGRIALHRNYVGGNPQQNLLMPGMTVEADIITGEKTVLGYLLKPIQVARERALRER